MVVISFVGCCGALKNVRMLLVLYSTILLLVLLAEIGLGIYAGVFTSNLRQNLSPALKLSIQNQYMGDMTNKSIASVAWDAIMFNVNASKTNE